MVAQFFDRNDGLLGVKNRNGRRTGRTWPKLPLSERLQRWFERTVKRSAFMRTSKNETRLQLPASLTAGLSLQSPDVLIVSTKLTIELQCTEREYPLAVIRL